VNGVKRGPVGRLNFSKEKLNTATDLRHDPSTLTFGSGFPFAGRSRNEGLRSKWTPCETALQAFRESVSMTEGARSFRRRGALALVFLAPDQKSGPGPAKSGQQNGAHAKALHLEASTHAAFFNQSNLSVKSSKATCTIQRKKSSVIVLGGEPAVARRHRFPGPKAQIKKG